jgi:hypothetical protein
MSAAMITSQVLEVSMTTITVPAVYRDGALHPQVDINLPDNTPVEVQVTLLQEGNGEPSGSGGADRQPPTNQSAATQALKLSEQVRQLAREDLIRIARQAKGSLSLQGATAAEVIRRLRDEWPGSGS